jgi:hypothetical protein
VIESEKDGFLDAADILCDGVFDTSLISQFTYKGTKRRMKTRHFIF